MTTSCRVEILETPDLLAIRGAELFLAAARRACEKRGRFSVAISGGNSPIPLFRRLALQAATSGVDWARIHFFWADERCVPADHRDSNYRLAHEQLLSHLPDPGAVIHRIRGELDPEEGAREYVRDLEAFFPACQLPEFDQIWLGLGEDGHTASLFPDGDPEGWSDNWAVPVYVGRLSSHRVTLTLPALNCSHQVFFIATGAAKADIVAKILERGAGARYPASLVAPPAGTVTWLLDREAARWL